MFTSGLGRSWTRVAQDVDDGEGQVGWSPGGDFEVRIAPEKERQYLL